MNSINVDNAADASEIYFYSEKSKRLELADGRIKVKSAESNEGYGLRVLDNGKLGFSYFTDETNFENALANAIAISKYSERTGFSFPEKRRCASIKSSSRRVVELSAEEIKGMIMQMEDILKKNKQRGRIVLETARANVEIENSAGLDAKTEYTKFTAYCEAMKKDGFGFSYYSGVDVLHDPMTVATEASEMCNNMVGAKKLTSGKYCVVFSPEAIQSMLDIMLPSISGDWKRKKMSKLSKMKGKRIFSEPFSIYEDATIDGSRMSAFDGEGIPAKRIPIVEKGILKNFVYDRETAALEGVREEGCCSRVSYQAKPHISISNLEISAGKWNSFESELKEFVQVKSVHGIHTSNITTGDFGVEANTAFKITNGEKQAARGFIISGNIFTMLNGILGIEKKQKTYDNLTSPSIAIEKLQIIG